MTGLAGIESVSYDRLSINCKSLGKSLRLPKGGEINDIYNCIIYEWFKKLLILKKGIGIEKASDEKVCKQGKRSLQIVWKRVRDGDQGSLKSEMELKDH